VKVSDAAEDIIPIQTDEGPNAMTQLAKRVSFIEYISTRPLHTESVLQTQTSYLSTNIKKKNIR